MRKVACLKFKTKIERVSAVNCTVHVSASACSTTCSKQPNKINLTLWREIWGRFNSRAELIRKQESV
jgi:hypothetical protein